MYIYPEILFFTSAHCSPCKPVEKLLKRINMSLFGKKLKIKKIDISNAKYNDIIRDENVLSVPTIIIGKKKLVSSSIEEIEIVDSILNCFLKSVSLGGK